MKLSTKFNISAYIVVFSSIVLANYLGELNLGYVVGSITWTIATTLIAISSEAIKIEKKWR
ncbi:MULTISPECIES: hypothetical protein [Psychrilyobacter]|uniref:Uncharacterized protein n=1 Tax=Psychrilyobacter piezotolerans TaxID=2293438 RepID=A0ABX9KJI9_9FUSO|nr:MULTISPECIES: hypothetical protein [Psychrilyobacter]MCS5421887.1 hypothetical protein [Psychrilyobacter sp. S5]NDI76958.1 hypothetical protein [Psychrilyobacter piezotolerans]RDE64579.1 hypothetical protein DV867_03295 [Psychrilyobacter sp. S5]REI42391.1 hypothetical protein DYH56_03295 [Psychrilyobacter piezotolerans]